MSQPSALLHSAHKPNRLVRNLGLTFFEAVITRGLNFFLILLLTRTLGPSEYGKYSFIFVAVSVMSALFDFGMENTAVRFSARDKAQMDPIFGLYLILKLGILTIVIVILVLAQHWLFSAFNKSELMVFMPFLIVGLLGESLFFVNDTYCQANQWFQLRAILNIVRFLICFLLIGTLFFYKALTLHWVLYVYAIPFLFSLLFLGQYIKFISAFWKSDLPRTLMTEIVGYQKWMFIYSVANNLLSRLDFLMLGLWVSYAQLGIYNAAVQLCTIIAFLPLVLGKVLLPTLSDLDESQVFHISEKIIPHTLLLVFVALTLIPMSPLAIPFLFGKQYELSIGIFQVLVMAYAASLMSMPFEQALYSLGKPDVLCASRYGQLAVIILLNAILIPFWGIYGAAVSNLIGRLLYLLQTRLHYLRYQQAVCEKKEPQWVVGS
jgi:O-antigen/teichoic acid export membrane protein